MASTGSGVRWSTLAAERPELAGAGRAQFLAERGWSETPPPNWAAQQVFELLIERCLHTTTTGHGDFQPVDTVWRPTSQTTGRGS